MLFELCINVVHSPNFHAFQFRIYLYLYVLYIFEIHRYIAKHTCWVLRSRPKYVAIDESSMLPT